MTPAGLQCRSWIAVAAALAAVPVLLTPLYPGLDLPWHALFAAVIHEGGQRSLGMLEVDLQLSTYASYYALVDGLAHLMSITAAMQVVLVAVVVAWVASSASLLTSAGRDPRVAIAAAPLVYSASLAYGFAAFALAYPVILWTWSAALRTVARARAVPVGVVVLGSALLALTHAVSSAIGLFGVAAVAATARQSLRRRALALAGALVGSLPSLIALSTMGADPHSPVPPGVSWWQAWWAQPRSPLLEAVVDLGAEAVAPVPGAVSALGMLAALAVIGLAGWRGAGQSSATGEHPRARPLGWLLGLLVLVYLLLPFDLDWPRDMVAAPPRLIPLVWVLALVLVAPRRLARSNLWAMSILSALLVAAVAARMHQFSEEASDFRAVARAALPEARTLALIEQPPVRERRPASPWRHAGAYVAAERGGIVSNIPRWARTQPWVPVQVGSLPPAPPPGQPRSFSYRDELPWEQIIIRDADPEARHPYLPITAEHELRWRAGRWRLYVRPAAAGPADRSERAAPMK